MDRLHHCARTLACLAPIVAAGALSSGCLYTRAQTDTPRTATEQLLLTRSIEQAVADLELPPLAERRVTVEVISLAGSDADYLRAALEARLRRLGARVVPAAEAEMILSCFVGGLGTISRGLEFGIPPVPVGAYATPGLPLMRILKQRGYTQLRVVARDAQGSHIDERGPVIRRARFDVYSILMLAIRSNDIYPGENFELAFD